MKKIFTIFFCVMLLITLLSITAFAEDTYTFTIVTEPAEGGFVTDENGVVSGPQVYPAEKFLVNFNAAPHEGYHFKSWKKDGSSLGSSPSYAFPLDGDHTITAIFEKHSFSYKSDDSGHWYQCECGAKKEVEKHSYKNACDNTCDCGYTRKVPAHDYKAATCKAPKTCKICGATSGSKAAHKYDAGKVTKAATCNVTGTKIYTCSVCKGTKTEAIAKKKHTYNNSCDTNCNVCKATRTITHTYKTTTTKATLTKNGSVVKKCTVCGKVASNTPIRYAKNFTLSATSYTYTGTVKTPTVTVKDYSGKVLKKNTDYTVTYASGRKNVGTYKVTVTMKGKYTGTKVLYFKINPVSNAKGSYKLSSTSYIYNGSIKAPAVTVKNSSGKTLVRNTDYTVTYASGRRYVGTYKVTVKMKGNYTGTKTLTFKIIPKAASVNTLTAGNKKLTVKLNRSLKQSTGYQIQYSTNKAFKNAKTKTIPSYKTSSTTLTGLKAKTTYYIRVRTYKTVGKTKYYSNWSSCKYKKTK